MKMKKGFTLVELLIVMAIIGILATVLLPGMLEYRKNARESKFIQTAKNYQASLILCCDQYGGQISADGEGQPICEPDVDSVWPEADMIGAISASECNYGSFSVKWTPSEGAYGSCTSATITQSGVAFTGCKTAKDSGSGVTPPTE